MMAGSHLDYKEGLDYKLVKQDYLNAKIYIKRYKLYKKNYLY